MTSADVHVEFLLDDETVDCVERLAATMGVSRGVVVLQAVAYGLNGDAISAGLARPPLSATPLPGRVVAEGRASVTIALSREAASFAERAGVELGGAEEPLPVAEIVRGFLGEGLCDLDRLWLGARDREWSTSTGEAAEVLWAPDTVPPDSNVISATRLRS